MIQSILFSRKYFTRRSSLDWLKNHHYKHHKLDITKDYIRARQFDPRYRIINFEYPSIKAVYQF